MSEAIRARLRQEYEARFPAPRVETIELGRVRDYLLALDEPADIGPGDAVPPLFLLTLGRTRRPQPSKGGAVKAGDAYEFIAPVRVGERITIEFRLKDIEEKQGRMGQMFLLTQEWTYRNESGATVARATTTSLRWGQ
jgi:hypothetical protein